MNLVDVGAGPIERARAIAAVAESMGATATLDYFEFAPPPRVHAYAVRIELRGRVTWALATANVHLRVAAERYGVGAPDGCEESYALVVDPLDAGLPGLLRNGPITTHEAIDALARALDAPEAGQRARDAADARSGSRAERRRRTEAREQARLDAVVADNMRRGRHPYESLAADVTTQADLVARDVVAGGPVDWAKLWPGSRGEIERLRAERFANGIAERLGGGAPVEALREAAHDALAGEAPVIRWLQADVAAAALLATDRQEPAVLKVSSTVNDAHDPWRDGALIAVRGLALDDRAAFARFVLTVDVPREGADDGPWDVVSRVQHSIGVIGTQGPKRYVRGIDELGATRWTYPGWDTPPALVPYRNEAELLAEVASGGALRVRCAPDGALKGA